VLECICSDPDEAWSRDPWKEYSEDVDSWAGAHSMPAARDQYQYGWERLAEEMSLGNPAHTVNRAVENEFDVVRDTSGGCVDMGAFVSGVPENMLNFVMHERSRRTISILYNVCASGSTDKDSLIMRGMKVASICDYFEKCGYRVRIDVCDTASGYNNGTGAAWNLV
jgi:hypothetical protein